MLKGARYNLFGLKSDDVLIDLLTDSGTGAMSAAQWSAVMRGDESYAGPRSFYRFEAAVRNLMHFNHIISTHPGRAAEAILFSIFGGAGQIIPNNTHFDTTRGNIEVSSAAGHDLVIAKGKNPSNLLPFKGNMDLTLLEVYLKDHGDSVPCVMITVTNNTGGGQPVSLENIRATGALAHEYGKPFIIDGSRFAENAWFIKEHEAGQGDRSIPDIVRDCFADADSMTLCGSQSHAGPIPKAMPIIWSRCSLHLRISRIA